MPKSKFAGLFNACGWIASAFLLMILILIVIQVVGRLAGFSTPGITNYGGYCMSAASFYGLSYAMHHNAHIRVSLFLELSKRLRYAFELWCHVIGTGLAAYFCYYAFKATYYSYKFHDVSQGQDATPLWIPQLLIACVGTVCFLIVLGERLYWILSGQYSFENPESQEA